MQQLRDTIELLDCSRIDYGYRVLDDESLVQDCLDRGIVFTTVPTNLSSKYNDAVDPGSIRGMVDQGLKVTINSDDPLFFDCSVAGDLRQVAGIVDLDVERHTQFAIDAAFMPEADRRRLAERVADWWQRQSVTSS